MAYSGAATENLGISTPNQPGVAEVVKHRSQQNPKAEAEANLPPPSQGMSQFTVMGCTIDQHIMLEMHELHPCGAIKELGWDMTDRSDLPIGGRLKYYLNNWQVVTGDSQILKVVQGYDMDLTTIPPKGDMVWQLNMPETQKALVQEEVNSLLQKQAIVPVQKDEIHFWSQIFLREKKGGGTQASVQPQEAESIHKLRAFQDGEHCNAPDTSAKSGLDGQNGHQRCLLECPNSPEQTEPVRILVGGTSVQVQSMPVRTGVSTPHVHKVNETSGGSVETIRHSDNDLSGRLLNYESEQGQTDQRQRHNSVGFSDAGVSDQLEKVQLNPDPTNRIPGVSGRHSRTDSEIAGRQGSGYQRTMSGNVNCPETDSKTLSEIDRQVDSLSSSSVGSTLALQAVANAKDQGIASREPVIRGTGGITAGMQAGTALVDIAIIPEQWESDNVNATRIDLHLGCQQEGLGGRVQWTKDPGSMVNRGISVAHKHFRDESCGASGESVYEERIQCALPPETGQQFMCGTNQQDGRDQVPVFVSSSEQSMAILSGPFDHTYCGTFGRSGEYNCGRDVSRIQRCQQLETTSTSFSNGGSDMGTTGHRPVCGQVEHTTGQVCQLEARSTCNSGGLILNELGGVQRVCISTVLPDQQVSRQDSERTSNNSNDYTSVAYSDLVSTDAGNAPGFPDFAAPKTGLVAVPEGRAAPTPPDRQYALGSLESNGPTRGNSSLSKEAAEIVRDARRTGTQKAYSSSWTKWSGWCNSRQLDPFCAPVEHIMNFLTEQFNSGMEYSTVNGYRSAISAEHIGVDGIKVGQHPRVCTLLKGMFNRRPPQPRYTETWEVDKVLDLFRKWPVDSGLDLKKLSLKVTMLMALTGAMRQSELQLLRWDHCLDKGDEFHCIIAGLTKTRRVGQGPLSLIFKSFPEEKLDVVASLRAYLARTARLRKRETQLLISYVRPHGKIVACSVARWLQEVMKLAGIDTEKYKAHSTRGASASKARRIGLSVQEIMERANWLRESTFRKFYYRETENTTFQSVVLTKKR